MNWVAQIYSGYETARDERRHSRQASFERDKEWADSYLPQLSPIIRQCTGDIIDLRIATEIEDRSQATDLVVSIPTGTLAIRIRKPHIWANAYRALTLRSSRPSGRPQELDKIKKGWARWYLYTWAGYEHDFCAWVFVDLDKLRTSGRLAQFSKDDEHDNRDGSSKWVDLPISDIHAAGAIVRMHPDDLRAFGTYRIKHPSMPEPEELQPRKHRNRTYEELLRAYPDTYRLVFRRPPPSPPSDKDLEIGGDDEVAQ